MPHTINVNTTSRHACQRRIMELPHRTDSYRRVIAIVTDASLAEVIDLRAIVTSGPSMSRTSSDRRIPSRLPLSRLTSDFHPATSRTPCQDQQPRLLQEWAVSMRRSVWRPTIGGDAPQINNRYLTTVVRNLATHAANQNDNGARWCEIFSTHMTRKSMTVPVWLLCTTCKTLSSGLGSECRLMQSCAVETPDRILEGTSRR